MALRVHVNPKRHGPRWIKILPPAPLDGPPARFGIPPRRLRPDGTRPPLVMDLVSKMPTIDEVVAWLHRGPNPGLKANALCSTVQAAEFRTIVLRIDSWGGEPAYELAGWLCAHGWCVRAQIVGACHSSAALIALCADEIVVRPHARVTLHRPATLMSLPRYDALSGSPSEERKRMVDELRELEAFDVDLIAARMGVTHTAAREMITAERTWTAAEAVAVGFADRVEMAKAAA